MTRSMVAEVAELKKLPITELKAKYRTLMGAEPSVHSRATIEARLAYRLQELRFGGLSQQTRRRLDALADAVESNAGNARARARSRPTSGTTLVREYRGVEHRVIVRDDGYEYGGRMFKSLSAVARAITGTPWSGLVFFGLKARASK
jgi:hypothetical protein